MRCMTTFTHCDCTFNTDVPQAFGGEGQYVSPADMLAATVASCMLSMAGLTGKKHGFDTEGITAEAACTEENGQLSALCVTINVPKQLTEKEKQALQTAVAHCPVGNALNDRIHKDIRWTFAD